MWKNKQPKWAWKKSKPKPKPQIWNAKVCVTREEYTMMPLRVNCIDDPRYPYDARPYLAEKIASFLIENNLLSITRNVDEYNHSIVYTGTIYVGKKKYDT